MTSLFKSTVLLYIALLLGQIIFCFVIVFLLTQPDKVVNWSEEMYPYVGLAIVGASGATAWYLNKLRLESLPKLEANMQGKVLHYRTSVILRCAVVEWGNLFCLVVALLTQSMMPILYFCLGLGVFLYFRPSLGEFSSLYNITSAEYQELERTLKQRK